jgi:transposase-like protein
MPIIEGKILEGSTIHADGWKAYDGLVLNGYNHYRVFHSRDEFARGKSHANGITKESLLKQPHLPLLIFYQIITYLDLHS